MPIPNPSLDDLTFDQLLEEAKKSIPLLSKNWTNFNPSDPGITILELLAWLVDMKIYSLNRYSKNSYLKFLQLTGTKPQEEVLPKLDITIQTIAKGSNIRFRKPLKINRGFPLIVKDELLFVETNEDLFFIPSFKISRCIVYSNQKYVEVNLPSTEVRDKSLLSSSSSTSSLFNSDAKNNIKYFCNFPLSLFDNTKPYFFLFGPNPQEGKDEFYLCLEFDSDEIDNNSEVSISFYLYEKDLPEKGSHDCGFSNPLDMESFKSEVEWAYAKTPNVLSSINDLADKTNTIWHKLHGSGISDYSFRDSTLSFSRNGKVSFKFPLNPEEPDYDYFLENNIPIMNDSTKDSSKEFANETINGRSNDTSQVELIFTPTNGENPKQRILWLRCRLIKNRNYFIPPRIEGILTNTVSCNVGYTKTRRLKNQSSLLIPTVSKKHGPYGSDLLLGENDLLSLSNGLPNQSFMIPEESELPLIWLDYLEVGNKKWICVDDFDASKPLDSHYILVNKKNGIFGFGDGEKGKIPRKGSKISVKYRYGLVQEKYIRECKYFKYNPNHYQDFEVNSNKYEKNHDIEINKHLYSYLVGINFFPSTKGKPAESISDAILRAQRSIIEPFKIASINDYEYIVKNTPGLRVGRVKAKSSSRQNKENTTIVSVFPYSPLRKLDEKMSNDFNIAIKKHLDKHRLISTAIEVLPLYYIDISIDVKIKLNNFSGNHKTLKDRIAGVLSDFFSLVSFGSSDGKHGAWDFGQNVYKSQIIAYLQSMTEVNHVLRLGLNAYGSNGYHMDNEGNIIVEDLNIIYLKDVFISFV